MGGSSRASAAPIAACRTEGSDSDRWRSRSDGTVELEMEVKNANRLWSCAVHMCDEQATKQEVRSMEVVAKIGPVENLIYRANLV